MKSNEVAIFEQSSISVFIGNLANLFEELG